MQKGSELEKRASKANRQYHRDDKALILKIPVPVMITRKGLISKPSTVDYTGLIEGGKFIAFDVKETLEKTRFPLKNIKQHQLLYLEIVKKLGGIAFFLIHFKNLYPNHAYITPIDLVSSYFKGTGRKSIPIKDFNKDWLTSIDDYLPHLLCLQHLLQKKS